MAKAKQRPQQPQQQQQQQQQEQQRQQQQQQQEQQQEQQQQEQQQQQPQPTQLNNLANTMSKLTSKSTTPKSKSHSKPKSKSKCKFMDTDRKLLRRANVMTVLKTQPTPSKPLVAPNKKFKWRPKKPKQPLRRSKLMANALLPLMSSNRLTKKPRDAGGKATTTATGTATTTATANGTQTLLVIRESLEHMLRSRRQLRERKKALTASLAGRTVQLEQPTVSVETFYDKKAQTRGGGGAVAPQRLTPMPFKHNNKLHLREAGGGGGGGGVGVGAVSGGGGGLSNGAASGQSSGGNSAAGVKQTANTQSKQPEVEVPLTTRLPIIDFISTDDFARMHAFKKPKAARRLAKPSNE